MKLVFALLPLLLVAGCDSSDSDTARNQPDADLQLVLGETAISDGLAITFEAVTGDSRCPEGVECVWAGEARIRLDIDGTAEQLLVSDPEVEPDAGVRRGDVILRAVALTPYPGSEGDQRGDALVAFIDTEAHPPQQPEPPQGTREETLALELGNTATVADLSITFARLEYESRCPLDGVCGTNGNAIASLLIEDEGGLFRAFANAPGLTNTFKTLVHETDRSCVFLTNLSPHPGSEAAYRGDPLTVHLLVETSPD